MQITRNDLDTGAGPGDWFTGDVYIDTITTPSNDWRIGAAAVHFTPHPAPAPPGTSTRTARRSGLPKASASANAKTARSK